MSVPETAAGGRELLPFGFPAFSTPSRIGPADGADGCLEGAFGTTSAEGNVLVAVDGCLDAGRTNRFGYFLVRIARARRERFFDTPDLLAFLAEFRCTSARSVDYSHAGFRVASAEVTIDRCNTIGYCSRRRDWVAFYRHGIGLEIVFENDGLVEFALNSASRLSIADAHRASVESPHGNP